MLSSGNLLATQMACQQKEQQASCAMIENPYAKLLSLLICAHAESSGLIGGTSTYFALISQLIWRLSTHLRPSQCAWKEKQACGINHILVTSL